MDPIKFLLDKVDASLDLTLMGAVRESHETPFAKESIRKKAQAEPKVTKEKTVKQQLLKQVNQYLKSKNLDSVSGVKRHVRYTGSLIGKSTVSETRNKEIAMELQAKVFNLSPALRPSRQTFSSPNLFLGFFGYKSTDFRTVQQFLP